MTRSEIEAPMKGIVSDRFIELWWDLRLPGLGNVSPNDVFKSEPARLLEYTMGYNVSKEVGI